LDETLGENLLRRLRKERRMSQAEVARSVGLSRQSVNAIENGKCQPRLVVAYRLARLFGRPIEHVFPLDELEQIEHSRVATGTLPSLRQLRDTTE
jgi:putative transcriptional regulator